jgi:DNA-binding NarL/FixJ family response regulator
MKKIRVLIADDHALMRKGIHELLNSTQDMEVVGEAANGREAIELASQLCPDVILMDIVMPELDGIEATRKIKQSRPGIKILFFTAYDDEKFISAIIKLKASGYLLKNTNARIVLNAIRVVNEGESIIHPSVMNKILSFLKSQKQEKVFKNKGVLSPRELQVLKLGASGFPSKEIARDLHLSLRTVHAHWRNIFAKTSTNSRVEAIMECVRKGLVSLKNGKEDE